MKGIFQSYDISKKTLRKNDPVEINQNFYIQFKYLNEICHLNE